LSSYKQPIYVKNVYSTDPIRIIASINTALISPNKRSDNIEVTLNATQSRFIEKFGNHLVFNDGDE